MDRKLIAEAYRLYYRQLYSYAYSLTQNKADSEDLVSEAFVRAILSWSGKGSLRAWLFRVLKNLFIDETRRKKHLMEDRDDLLQDLPDPRPQEEQGNYESRRQWLEEQMKQMSREDREILVLSLYSGMNDKEIAEHLGIRADNLRVKRHRIRKRLKEEAERGNRDE